MRNAKTFAIMGTAFLCLTCLPSCLFFNGIDRRRDIVVPGYFIGSPEEENAPYDYALNVAEIGEEGFVEAKGTNVLRDELTGRFYSIRLKKTRRSTGEIEDFVFENMRDSSPGIKALPITYIDDHNFSLSPIWWTEGSDYRYSTFAATSHEILDDFRMISISFVFIPRWVFIPTPE